MNEVAYISPAECLKHHTGPGHPESVARLDALNKHISQCGLSADLRNETARRATRGEVAAAHQESHIDKVAHMIEMGARCLDADTAVGMDSLEAAFLAAGAALTGIELIQKGAVDRVFCGVRPPGHHAENNHAMGFCIFNNAAVAACRAMRSGLAEKVLIIDWDVHHGNGTQQIFESSDSVFYYSLHQFPFYPGTGAAHETGKGQGRGYTLNRPLSAGTGDDDYLRLIEKDLGIISERFGPELIIISAGFDAHREDPLGAMRITDRGFGRMTEIVADMADSCCGGRILSVLEGGYNLKALASSVEHHLRALRS